MTTLVVKLLGICLLASPILAFKMMRGFAARDLETKGSDERGVVAASGRFQSFREDPSADRSSDTSDKVNYMWNSIFHVNTSTSSRIPLPPNGVGNETFRWIREPISSTASGAPFVPRPGGSLHNVSNCQDTFCLMPRVNRPMARQADNRSVNSTEAKNAQLLEFLTLSLGTVTEELAEVKRMMQACVPESQPETMMDCSCNDIDKSSSRVQRPAMASAATGTQRPMGLMGPNGRANFTMMRGTFNVEGQRPQMSSGDHQLDCMCVIKRSTTAKFPDSTQEDADFRSNEDKIQKRQPTSSNRGRSRGHQGGRRRGGKGSKSRKVRSNN